jgi:hypothetical protein
MVHVNAAPSHQDKNGLAWLNVICKLWFPWLATGYHWLNCAVEVCDYFPFKLEDGSYTTPFELAHHKKT